MPPHVSTRRLNIRNAEILHTTEISQNCLKRGNPADIPYISEIPTAWNFGQSPVITLPIINSISCQKSENYHAIIVIYSNN